jgi:hypothetical protein
LQVCSSSGASVPISRTGWPSTAELIADHLLERSNLEIKNKPPTRPHSIP